MHLWNVILLWLRRLSRHIFDEPIKLFSLIFLFAKKFCKYVIVLLIQERNVYGY